MAWTNLPTDYQDAVWSGNRKFAQINNPDGTVSFEDKTEYTQKENSFFGAKDANQINSAINNIMAMNILDTVYPVGSIYMSVNSTNPGTLFGGTWEAWGSGRVPVGMGSNGTTNYPTVEATGGAESRSHSHASATSGAASGNTGSTTLTTNQIPAHTHAFNQGNIMAYGDGNGTAINIENGSSGFYALEGATRSTGGGSGHTHTLNSHTHSIPASDSKSTDVRQPYITCYMWKRTA